MPKLDDLAQTDNSFYSTRSDGSTLLAVKIQNVFASAQWMLIRTQPNRRVHSDHWVFSKLNGKDSVSFPVVATEELKQVARDGDFLEWQIGLDAPAQSEQEIVLNQREKELKSTIKTAREAFEQKEQQFLDKVQALLAEWEQRDQETQQKQAQHRTDTQEALDQKEHTLEERIHTFLSDLQERQGTLENEHNDVLAKVQEGHERFQEQHEASLKKIEQQGRQAQLLMDTFQQSFDDKEQALSRLVGTKTQEIEEKVHTLQTDLTELKPLSAEKYRQEVGRKASWLSLWLIIAAVAFLTLIVFAAPLFGANTVLIDTFGGVSTFLALLIAGTTFFMRTRHA